MKRIISTLTLIIGLNVLNAQTNPLKIVTKSDEKLDGGKVEQLSNGNFILTKYYYKKWQYFNGLDLSMYDKNLNFVKSSHFEPIKGISTEGSIKWIPLADKTLILFTDPQKNSNVKFHVASFSESDLLISPTLNFLFESNGKTSQGDMTIPISDDKSKFAIINEYRNKDMSYFDNHTLSIWVYDKDLNKIYGGDYQTGATKQQMWGPSNMYWDIEFEKAKLTNQGNLLSFIQVKNGDKYNTSHLELLLFSKNLNTPKKQPLQIPNYHINSASFHEDTKGNMYIVGSYGDPSMNNKVIGSYYVKVDQNTGELASNIQLIPIPSNLPTERSEKLFYRSGTLYFITHGVHFLNNGTMNIVTELYKKSPSTYNTQANELVNEQIDTYGLEVFVINVNPSTGMVNHYKEIKKLQKAFNMDGESMSISLSQKGNVTNIFYIDNPSNFKLKSSEAPIQYVNKNAGNIIVVTVNEKGEIAKYNLGSTENIASDLRIRKFNKGVYANIYSSTEKNGKAQIVNIISD